MDIQQIRELFPQLVNVLYFNTGTSGPTPIPVINEIKRYLDMAVLEGQASPLIWCETIKLNLRKKISDLFHVLEEEICLTYSTSDGLGIVFSGIDWIAEDEIIVTYPEYISGMLDCQNVAEQYGVKLNIVNTDDNGYIREKDIIAQINDRTKLLLVSHVNYHNGQRLNLEEICNDARKKGVLTLVDGAQSLGAIKVDIKLFNPDFYVFPAQKWLLGEEGMGGLYINKDSLDKIKPRRLGYNSVEKFTPEGFNFHGGARRFEVATPSYASYYAFSSAIDFYNMIGEEFIFSRIKDLTDYFKRQIIKKGIKLLTPSKYDDSGGLVSFIIPGVKPQELADKLYREQKIIIRSIPLPECLRVSIHYFNTEDEIDRLLQSF